jgi:lysophospholipase L1-like esterase
MPRVVIFAKGNVDVKDTLHSLTVGSQHLWNGLNEIVRVRYPGTTIRVRHETWTRSDALLATTGQAPPELAERPLALAAYPLRSQFSHALFEAEADAFILSLQPDITTSLFQHRERGHLFYPNNHEDWPVEDQLWLRQNYIETATLNVEQSMCNFARIVERIRKRTGAPILIYNLSAVIPGEWVHCYEGLGETYSTRIRRFNLALTELSQRTGLSIVDVDRIVSRAGADRVKIDTVHLNADGCRLVAEEVVRILEDLGVLTIVETQP